MGNTLPGVIPQWKSVAIQVAQPVIPSTTVGAIPGLVQG